MEFPSIVEVLTIILGNGVIIALLGHYFQINQAKAEKDFEARKEGRAYYKEIYGHIAILQDLAETYGKNFSSEKIEATDYKAHKAKFVTPNQLLNDFNEWYLDFESIYIKHKKEGFEIFIPTNLQQLLVDFWVESAKFHEDNKLMQNLKLIENYCRIGDKTTDCMEKIFGLKGGTKLSLRKKAKQLFKRLKSLGKT